MRKILCLILCVALLGCAQAFAEETAPGLQRDLVILFTSDVHCGVIGGEYENPYGQGRIVSAGPAEKGAE